MSEEFLLDSLISNKVKEDLGIDYSLTLFWQPKASLFSGDVSGAEALIRGIRKDGSIVMPSEIIPLLENSHHIHEVGSAIIEAACTFASTWSQFSPRELTAAINISSQQLSDKTLLDNIKKALEISKLSSRMLEIEVTETMVMDDKVSSLKMLQDIKNLGVRISIDDFGTGYSSMSYLQSLPISGIKIDKSFIDPCPQDNASVQIVKAIVQMGKSLRLKVIAEGIENESQCRLLSSFGCNELQGWHFSKALSEEDFIKFIKDNHKIPLESRSIQANKRTLLIVDDEVNIIAALKRCLRRDGYTIYTATSALEALDLMSVHSPGVILSDQRMPGMTGVEMFRRSRTILPDSIRIILSGYTELESVTSAINEGAVWKFLTKPWDDQQLSETIAEAFKVKEISDENEILKSKIETANHELTVANFRLESLLLETKHKTSLLQEQIKVYQNIFEIAPVIMFGTTEDGLIVLANKMARNIFGEAFVDRYFEEMFSVETKDVKNLEFNNKKYLISVRKSDNDSYIWTFVED